MPRSLFVEGPAGTGKTTSAVHHIRSLLADDVLPESVLVLVPQPTLGIPYQRAFIAPGWPAGAQTDVLTLGALARRGLELFWPLVAARAGFAQPNQDPTFLTIETAQYFLARFVREAVQTGVFDSISVTPFNIMRQALDALSKAAVNHFPLDEVAERLIAAWGDRHSSRPPVYRAAQDVLVRFREHCLANNLLDFSLLIEVYVAILIHEPAYQDYFRARVRHLVADNLEESFPVTADFVRWAWDGLDSARLVYDTGAGYRLFLGADPAGMVELRGLCDEVETRVDPVDGDPALTTLARDLEILLDSGTGPAGGEVNPRTAFTFEIRKFYPQMMDWVAEQIDALIAGGVPPREIVVLAPLLGDSLRFALAARLEERGIPTVSHRPSRAMRDEPAARAVLTLLALAHPEWGYAPPAADVADALHQVIEELDPVRAWLLAQIIYRPGQQGLTSYDVIQPEMQQRVTYRAGEKVEQMRAWLAAYRDGGGNMPPDHFLSRLFGELLAQPGFGFHTNLDAGRVVAELIQSARRFRQTLYPEGVDDWQPVSREYFELVQQGLLAGLYVSSWRDEEKDAVFLAPAYTFLMRNRRVDYQFWLDVGSAQWAERLEQPLTHPYVLARSYPRDAIWTDEMEFDARTAALRRLVVGLVRRCRRQVFAAITDLGEQGYEQRGPLLSVIQTLLQHYPEVP